LQLLSASNALPIRPNRCSHVSSVLLSTAASNMAAAEGVLCQGTSSRSSSSRLIRHLAVQCTQCCVSIAAMRLILFERSSRVLRQSPANCQRNQQRQLETSRGCASSRQGHVLIQLPLRIKPATVSCSARSNAHGHSCHTRSDTI
jgi:hypothetical protein